MGGIDPSHSWGTARVAGGVARGKRSVPRAVAHRFWWLQGCQRSVAWRCLAVSLLAKMPMRSDTESTENSSTGHPIFVQLSFRGQITLPAKVRRAVGVEPGDPLAISVEEGRIVISPALLLRVEHYTDERVAEFAQAAELNRDELAEARRKWGK